MNVSMVLMTVNKCASMKREDTSVDVIQDLLSCQMAAPVQVNAVTEIYYKISVSIPLYPFMASQVCFAHLL